MFAIGDNEFFLFGMYFICSVINHKVIILLILVLQFPCVVVGIPFDNRDRTTKRFSVEISKQLCRDSYV